MAIDRRHRDELEQVDDRAGREAPAPGKRGITQRLPAAGATTDLAHPCLVSVQRLAVQGRGDDAFGLHLAGDAVQEVADRGVSGAGGTLPHADRIQASFGHHDVSQVRAHVGGAAADAAGAIGARAYATGQDVAFASAPDLHDAAHEAAHVVQQRAGVSLAGGVGREGDPYERQADMVADRVVRGESAEDLLPGAPASSVSGGAVQRLVRIGDVPEEATRPQHLTVAKVLELLEGPVGSPALAALLSFLSNSPTSHLHIEFETVQPEQKLGKTGGQVHGQTGIFLGDRRIESASMLQEVLLVDPTPLLSPLCGLTVSVRIFLRPDTTAHELATTIIHELELHAVPAAALLRRIEVIRSQMGNDAEKVIGAMLQYLAAPDEHGNIERAIAMIESGRQVLDACAGTGWEGWAKATLKTICNDAEEQFLSVALTSRNDTDVRRVKYLQSLIESVIGEGPHPGPPPEKLASPHPYRTVNTGERTLNEPQILEYFAIGVRDRRTMEEMVEELGEKFGVPRSESIQIYNRDIAPQLFEEAPSKDSELLFTFMSSYGVPPPVTMNLLEQWTAMRETDESGELGGKGEKSDTSEKRGQGPPSTSKKLKVERPVTLGPPKERAFFTDPSTEDDWTPITNHYVPRSVRAAHAELPRGARILVDGYEMRVGYTDNGETPGASRVEGSQYGKYMALRMALKGG